MGHSPSLHCTGWDGLVRIDFKNKVNSIAPQFREKQCKFCLVYHVNENFSWSQIICFQYGMNLQKGQRSKGIFSSSFCSSFENTLKVNRELSLSPVWSLPLVSELNIFSNQRNPFQKKTVPDFYLHFLIISVRKLDRKSRPLSVLIWAQSTSWWECPL